MYLKKCGSAEHFVMGNLLKIARPFLIFEPTMIRRNEEGGEISVGTLAT